MERIVSELVRGHRQGLRLSERLPRWERQFGIAKWQARASKENYLAGLDTGLDEVRSARRILGSIHGEMTDALHETRAVLSRLQELTTAEPELDRNPAGAEVRRGVEELPDLVRPFLKRVEGAASEIAEFIHRLDEFLEAAARIERLKRGEDG